MLCKATLQKMVTTKAIELSKLIFFKQFQDMVALNVRKLVSSKCFVKHITSNYRCTFDFFNGEGQKDRFYGIACV